MRVTVQLTGRRFRCLVEVRILYHGIVVAPSLLWVPAGLDPQAIADVFNETLKESDVLH